MTTKGSVQAYPMKSAGRDEAAANARQKLLEAEGMAERLQMAAARQKRLKAEAELQTRLSSQMDAKKRERVLAQKRTAEKQKKHLESKFAKSKRVEDRQREDEKRRRLEEAMATAARELYGSRRTKVSIRSKILDPQSHYQMLGLVSLNIMPTDAEIKEAWRAQMQAHHPDRPGGSTEKAAQINSAADALSTEDKRTAYQRDGFWNGSGGR
ncbi:hypothetical protein BDY24DRAFT_176502 [Mrakia frigida]|uniref:uncharacterized protein n=1 Tax=Mrakia frigida TaxID=29902 RepID=UPI003FCC09ED